MSEKRMNVYTDKGMYILVLDEGQPYDDASVCALVSDLNMPGTIWHGWTPYDDPSTDPAIIVFGTGVSIESVKLYEVENVCVEEAPETPGVVLDMPIPCNMELDYLGNRCNIKAFTLHHSERSFDILPYEINGVPAFNALSPANITAILTSHFSKLGFAASDVRVIAPKVALSATDAVAYIEGINSRSDGTLHTGKAKAWHGWNDRDDPDAEE